MVEIVDFSGWTATDYSTSGTSSKVWLTDQDRIGLFKRRKSCETTEHVSEKLAEMLASKIGLGCARVDIGKYHQDIGSMSYLINDKSKNEDLTEGIVFISGRYPTFHTDTLMCSDENYRYSIEMVMNSLDSIVQLLPVAQREYARDVGIPFFKRQFLTILIFDALIGNTDRHHSNWAILTAQGQMATGEKGEFLKELSPIYDNGSSLCAYATEDIIDKCRRDKHQMDAIITTKSKSVIRIDPTCKTKPTHRQVLEYIKQSLNDSLGPFSIVTQIADNLNPDIFRSIINEFSDELLYPKKKEFLLHFLEKKREIICEVFR